ncbi:MAG TPA: ImmA/IrrE family metallo-endopeptidase [Clostridiales bacterium]|nr:ImmA/IrrE family metallo-endopeptidase [Clostridiales bacterium]
MEKIHEFAEKNNIDIRYTTLKCSCLSIRFAKDDYCIGIDPNKITSSTDERVKLIHDIGHCMTDSFYNTHSPCDLKSKHEYKADKWAIKKLLPFKKLKAFMKQGNEEVWEIAEYFKVTEGFVRKALKFYENDFLEDKLNEYYQ